MGSGTKEVRRELTPEEHGVLDFLREDTDGMRPLLHWLVDTAEKYFRSDCNPQVFATATTEVPKILRKYLIGERNWCAGYLREHPGEVTGEDDPTKVQLAGYKSLLRRVAAAGGVSRC
jgi:hypothetical protein